MPNLLAWILVSIAGVYVAIGVAFALFFVVRGVSRIDPAAEDGTIGFRVLIFPGTVAFWPLLMQRYQDRTLPPEESNAHRDLVRSQPDNSADTNPVEPIRKDAQ